MHDAHDDEFQKYLSQLHGTLEVLRADAQEQCEMMDAYNAPWEVRQDGVDFIDSVLALGGTEIGDSTTKALRALRELLVALPAEAIVPDGENMTTATGSIAAFMHPAWGSVRAAATLCLSLVRDLFG